MRPVFKRAFRGSRHLRGAARCHTGCSWWKVASEEWNREHSHLSLEEVEGRNPVAVSPHGARCGHVDAASPFVHLANTAPTPVVPRKCAQERSICYIPKLDGPARGGSRII